MNTYKIAVIAGDGIGKEVMPEAIRVLDALCGDTFQLDYQYFPWGSDYYQQHGVMMAVDGLDTLRGFDAIYFGAVGWTNVPDYVTLRGLRLKICQGFDQYANVRPTRLLPGIPSPLRDKSVGDIDFVVVRENTEGEYIGAGGRAHPGTPQETAVETTFFSRHGIERIMRFAFEMAQARRQHLISVTKSNAQQHSLRLWDDIFDELRPEYPDVKTERVLVDAMAARMVLKPESLDVLVASNLFADILTDLAGAIGGSLGVAASANLRPERDFPSMFEPVHGSAPDIYGQGIANPIGMLWSGVMMLEHLGETGAAQRLFDAVQRVTGAGQMLTPDVGGNGTTASFCDAVIEALET